MNVKADVTTDSSSSPANQDVKTPESSTGTPETKQDLLSVVMAVAPPKDDADDLVVPAKPAGEAKETPPDGEKPAAPEAKDSPAPTDNASDYKDPDEAELKRYGKEAQKRIRELISQRDAVRKEMDPLKLEAAEYRKLETFLTENQISSEEYNLLLGIGAALRKGDFKTFLDGINPYVKLAKEAMGELLPEDLQKQVDEGLVPEAVAKELVKARTEAKLASERVTTVTKTAEETQAQTQVVAVKSAITEWEKTTATRDPDYEAKKPFIHRFVAAQIASKGRPASPQAALDMAKAAYEEVTTLLGKTIPVKPTDPRPQPGGGPSGSQVVAEPKNLYEAALLGLQRTHS